VPTSSTTSRGRQAADAMLAATVASTSSAATSDAGRRSIPRRPSGGRAVSRHSDASAQRIRTARAAPSAAAGDLHHRVRPATRLRLRGQLQRYLLKPSAERLDPLDKLERLKSDRSPSPDLKTLASELAAQLAPARKLERLPPFSALGRCRTDHTSTCWTGYRTEDSSHFSPDGKGTPITRGGILTPTDRALTSESVRQTRVGPLRSTG